MPFITWVPADEFGMAKATAGFVIARSRGLALEDLEPEPAMAGDAPVISRKIDEAGWLRRITRGDRLVRVTYDGGSGELPLVDATFAPRKGLATADAFDQRMWRFYGVNVTASSAVIPLEPALSDQAR